MLELRDSKPSIAERFAARAAAWPAWRSPFGVLCRTFFAQFFASEVDCLEPARLDHGELPGTHFSDGRCVKYQTVPADEEFRTGQGTLDFGQALPGSHGVDLPVPSIRFLACQEMSAIAGKMLRV